MYSEASAKSIDFLFYLRRLAALQMTYIDVKIYYFFSPELCTLVDLLISTYICRKRLVSLPFSQSVNLFHTLCVD